MELVLLELVLLELVLLDVRDAEVLLLLVKLLELAVAAAASQIGLVFSLDVVLKVLVLK